MITKWRFIDPETESFSFERYQENVWTPDHTSGIPLDFGTQTRYGIPPGWTGRVLLDYEEWDIEERINDFLGLIGATRTLRPSADIGQYWKPSLNGGPVYQQAEATILRRADAVCPPLYLLRNLENLEGQLAHRRWRVEYCTT